MSDEKEIERYKALMVQAVLEIRGLRARIEAPFQETAGTPSAAPGPSLGCKEPIAVVGIGCRFPGADGPEAFWDLLSTGRSAVVEVPEDRWPIDKFYDAELSFPGTMNTRWGGFLDRVDLFDPNFFGIPAGEAASMDPQQRIALEVAWHALEDAGIRPDRLAGSRTGVFLGVSTWDYSTLRNEAPPRGGTGAATSIVANRISYLLDLRGPSLVIDTACSSSLVAVDLACESLRSGRTDLALAGGVNLILAPTWTISFSQAGMMAPDGLCKTFDKSANGYVRGEGCGIIVLKRLSQAITDGDHVRAVIRGSAANQDGRSNGLTAPNGLAQQAVIREALAMAGVQPDSVSYLEAHGTGTYLGDTIEVSALQAVLGHGRQAPCRLGSVKTNIGHLESAAGVAGLVKVILSLAHRVIPPHLNLRELNPDLHLDPRTLRIPTAAEPWTINGADSALGASTELRIAGVSSFGFGGTNAHVVLSEAPVKAPSSAVGAARSAYALTLSAKSDSALERLVKGYADHLRALPEDASIGAVAQASASARAPLSHRIAITVRDRADAIERLDSLARDSAALKARARRLSGGERPPRIAMLFAGQGAQYLGMGSELYEQSPVFRGTLDRIAKAVSPILDRPLLEVMWHSTDELLRETRYTQPALFAVEMGLFHLWESLGVKPTAVFGHSVGEIAAACAAEVMSLEAGARLIAERGRLLGDLPRGGGMAMIGADEATVRTMLAAQGGRVVIAALNGPTNTVVAGAIEDVEKVLNKFEENLVAVRSLEVSHAFHTPLVEPVLGPFAEVLAGMKFAAPRVPMFSGVTGARATLLDAAYWLKQLREPVRCSDALAGLAAECDVFLEIGPGATLNGMAKRALPTPPVPILSMKRGDDDWKTFLDAAGSLWSRGLDIEWRGVDSGSHPRVSIPRYPFERQRCWLDACDTKSFST